MNGKPDFDTLYDEIEYHLREGLSVNLTARKVKTSPHMVWKCIRERPHLAELATENGKRNQAISKYKTRR